MAYIGIDLGTTNTVAAKLYPKSKEKVKILEIEDEVAKIAPDLPAEDRKLVRSVVAFQNGQYLKGWKAFVYAKNNQRNTIFSIKRLMGRGYNDRQEYGTERNKGQLIRELMRKNWRFEIVRPTGATEDAVAVLLNEKEHSPQEISRHILLEMKRVAEASLGERIEGAVITVPAYFNERQCSATVEAANLAGVTVQRILPEPIASAKAYAMETLDLKNRIVLVYDLGGGTFDVTLLTIQGPNIEVETIDGDNWLGGDDFDREIVDALIDVIKRETGINPRNDDSIMFDLRMRAERAKKEISNKREAEILISDLFPGFPPVILFRESEKLADAIKHSPDKPYIEKAYEEIISEYIEETIQLVNNVLRRKNYEAEEVDKVLLVGGATKTPLVRRRLAEIFGEDKLITEKVDPMLAVAIGAAYEADSLIERRTIICPWYLKDGEPCATDNKIQTRICIKCGKPLPIAEEGNITERPYGIAKYHGEKKKNVFDVIIPKDEKYPLKEAAKRTYYVGASGARIMKVRFFAGKKWECGDFYEDIEKNEYQGTVWMLLPPETPAGSKVEIGFNLNKNKEMVDIFIECQGQVVKKEMISRGEKDEALGLRIEAAINKIQKLLSNGLGGIIPIDEPFTFAKGMRNYAYFLLREYYWLPFLQDESRKVEIEKTLKDLENVIGQGERAIQHKDKIAIGDEKAQHFQHLMDKGCSAMELIIESYRASGEHKEQLLTNVERGIKILDDEIAFEEIKVTEDKMQSRELDDATFFTAKLGALFADRYLDMLETIRVAISVAKGEILMVKKSQGKDKPIFIEPTDKYLPTLEAKKKAGSSEGLQDAKVMQEKLNEIIAYLKSTGIEKDERRRRDKIGRAEEAYRDIEPLILKWIVKVGV